jgi:hypothetical protein
LFSRLWHTHIFTWGPYAAFHGMALTCHIEGSMITAIWTHLRMFQNSKFYQFMLNVEFCLSRCLGAWTVVCTVQYRPWTGSIKPSLQHFQFFRVGLSLRVLISIYFMNELWIYKDLKARLLHCCKCIILWQITDAFDILYRKTIENVFKTIKVKICTSADDLNKIVWKPSFQVCIFFEIVKCTLSLLSPAEKFRRRI